MPIGPSIFPDGMKPTPPEKKYDPSVRRIHHPSRVDIDDGFVILTENGELAIVPLWHYPMGRRCLCGECTCYCKDCKETRDAVS